MASRSRTISGKLHRSCRIRLWPGDHRHQQLRIFMRYMCLVHFDPSIMETASLATRQDIDRRSLAYDEQLKAEGHYVASQAIQGGARAVLVRERKGQLATTEGPYIA